MRKPNEMRLKMVNFIRNKIIIGEYFTMEDICDDLNLSFENRFNTQRIYSIIDYWRKEAQVIFNDPEVMTPMKKEKTAAHEWDIFLYELNKRDVFLLYSTRRRGTCPMFYQPVWIDKEILDFVRMENKMKGQITVLLEMDLYGESLPKGMLKSPKEMAEELMGNLDNARSEITTKIEDKINSLIPPEDEGINNSRRIDSMRCKSASLFIIEPQSF